MKSGINEFLVAFNLYQTGELFREINMRKGNIIVFLLILALLENNKELSKYEVIRANKSPDGTTRTNIQQLERLGLITSKRSNQYFSRSYISLTEKGLLLKYKLRKVLLSPVG